MKIKAYNWFAEGTEPSKKINIIEKTLHNSLPLQVYSLNTLLDMAYKFMCGTKRRHAEIRNAQDNLILALSLGEEHE